MGRPPKSKEIKEEVVETNSGDLVVDQLDKYLKQNKDEHFNFEDDVEYEVSSGSLGIDMEIGGFGPGVHRLTGPSQTGKSPFSLEVARNFLKKVKNSRIVYIKAEGRLSEENKARSGLTFVTDSKDWKTGTVFIFKTNIYENAIGLMRTLVRDNPTECRYMFIIDSMDGMNLRNDFNKDIDEANKVAGAPLMTKQFLQKLSLAMTHYGHMCFFLSQITAEIKLDPYAKSAGRQVGSSGGNALQHFANEVLEFMERYEGDLILEDSAAKLDRMKNRALGHICKIKIKKSDKEKKFNIVEIPIKYGQTNGNSVWRERELADQMILWGMVTRAGAWTKVNEAFRKELKDVNIEIPEQFQGLDKLYTYLQENKEASNYLFEKFKKLVESK